MKTATHTKKAGRVRATGSADLKGTQAYPIGFGIFHARAFHSHRGQSERGQLGPLPSLVPNLEEPDDMGCFEDIDVGPPDRWCHNLRAEMAVPLGTRSS